MGSRGARYRLAVGAVVAALACCAHAAGAPSPEQGLPIISTFLPSRYNTPATPVGPQAFALATLPDSSVIVANNAGLLRLNGIGASTWNPTGGNVLSLASAPDGTLYAGGVGEIGWFREFRGEFHSLAPPARKLGVVPGDFWITIAARNGDVYFADTTHVFRWDGRELRVVYTGQPELLVGAALGDGAAILDPGAGLIALDGNGPHAVPGGARLVSASPCALAAAADGVVSVCADGSVLRWHTQGVAAQLALAPEVRALLQGAGITTAGLREDGMLLIGTRRAGIVMLDRDGRLIGHLAAVPEWGESRVFSQLLRRGDGFWVGLDYGVAHVEWPGQLTRFDASLGLPRAALATVRADGALLAASTRGVYRLVPPAAGAAFARFEPYVPTRATLFALTQTADALWLASGDGVYVVRNGAAQLIERQLAYAVLPLDADTVLAGGLSGARLLRRSDGAWRSQALRGIDAEIRHLIADLDGAIWLSGNYSGVYRVRVPSSPNDDAAPETFGAAQGLPPGRIVPLRLPDGIAFESADGPLRFDPRAHRFVADAALRAALPSTHGMLRFALPLDDKRAYVVQHDRVRLIEKTPDGTWRERFTPLTRLPRGLDYRDVRLDADGGVWIAGNEALFHHQPQAQSVLPDLPRPRALLEDDDGGLLPPWQGTRRFGTAPRSVHAHFEEAFFDGVEQLQFRTRLEPLESAWSDWQALPEREMTRLPGGEYRLSVQARDIFGRESPAAEIAFEIAPPLFLRWWALTLYALALAVLLVFSIRLRERRLRERAEELATLVSERTQELEHASVTDALTGLRNRHYVQLLEPSWRERKRGWWLIALVDIDHFKRINDERGHAAGDEALRAIAQRLRGVLSEAVTAVRWGGEEFLIVGELDDERLAAPLMRKLLCAIGNHPVALGDAAPLAVTCSIGWDVVAVEKALTLDAMLVSADHKLYAAKRAGRDRAHGPHDAVITRAPEFAQPGAV